jgi:hypothetical protein
MGRSGICGEEEPGWAGDAFDMFSSSLATPSLQRKLLIMKKKRKPCIT